MKTVIGMAIVMALVVGVNAQTGGSAKGSATALLGSAGYMPSPEKPVGWRGDWTGRYPGATPPLRWGHWSKGQKGLLCQAKKPKEGKPAGRFIPHGIVPEWLVLGPFPNKEADEMIKKLIPDVSAARPDEGDKAGTLAWKKIEPRVSRVYVALALGNAQDSTAFLHTYIYAPAAMSACFYGWGNRPWVNGKEAEKGREEVWPHQTVPIALAKGWNSILFRVSWKEAKVNFSSGHQFEARLYTTSRFNDQYESENIAWVTKMPGNSVSSPVVVGDRLFTVAEIGDLLCLDRKTGKILWRRSNNYYTTLGAEEKKGVDAAALQNLERASAELDKLNDEIVQGLNGFVNTTGIPGDQYCFSHPEITKFGSKIFKRNNAEQALNGAMSKVDAKYSPPGGWGYRSAAATPCTDGKFIYAHFMHGVVVCYDLDGKLIWAKLENNPRSQAGEHGSFSSPAIIDGKLITQRNSTVAFDCKTGAVAWRAKTPSNGTIVPVKLGKENCAWSTRVLYKVSDGTVVWETGDWGNWSVNWDTPVFDNDMLYYGNSGGIFYNAIKLPAEARAGAVPQIAKTVKQAMPFDIFFESDNSVVGSAIYYDGLYYSVTCAGVLHVIDFKTGALVYEKKLDIDPEMNAYNRCGVCGSLSMAGKYIYVMSSIGSTIIFEAGRQYKEAAKNVIDHSGGGVVLSDQCWSCPVFAGNDMYYRGHEYLYCFREK